MSIEFDCSEIENNLRNFLTRLEIGTNAYLSKKCSEELQPMLVNEAKWSKERTGEARRRLSATFTNKNGLADITLAHGVDYGVYLELAHKKGGEEFAPFAVIGPVVRREAPKIMAEYSEMIGRALK